jgi:hypothetical protein
VLEQSELAQQPLDFGTHVEELAQHLEVLGLQGFGDEPHLQSCDTRSLHVWHDVSQ